MKVFFRVVKFLLFLIGVLMLFAASLAFEGLFFGTNKTLLILWGPLLFAAFLDVIMALYLSCPTSIAAKKFPIETVGIKRVKFMYVIKSIIHVVPIPFLWGLKRSLEESYGSYLAEKQLTDAITFEISKFNHLYLFLTIGLSLLIILWVIRDIWKFLKLCEKVSMRDE